MKIQDRTSAALILAMALYNPMHDAQPSDADYPGQNDHKKRSRSHGGATKACVRDIPDLRERRKRERDARRRSR